MTRKPLDEIDAELEEIRARLGKPDTIVRWDRKNR